MGQSLGVVVERGGGEVVFATESRGFKALQPLLLSSFLPGLRRRRRVLRSVQQLLCNAVYEIHKCLLVAEKEKRSETAVEVVPKESLFLGCF